MNKKNIILIGFLIWILLGILCLLTHAKKIENKLTVRAQEQLKQANFADLKVSFSGRDALLSGKVLSDEMAQKAEDIIREIKGVRTVNNRLELEALTAAASETLAVVETIQIAEPSEKEAPKIDLSRFQINFASNSYQPGDNSGLTLNEIYKILNEHSKHRIKIVGHTDSQGRLDYNAKLSKKRAEAVKSDLVKKGIQPERLLVAGMGETKPIEDNSTPEGRRKNRRVEFIIVEEE